MQLRYKRADYIDREDVINMICEDINNMSNSELEQTYSEMTWKFKLDYNGDDEFLLTEYTRLQDKELTL